MTALESIAKCLESATWIPMALKSTLVISTIVVSFVAYRKYKRHLKRKAFPKDVVILHQFPKKGLRAPSASPYVMKLETWLRMAKIKYQNDETIEFGAKGKMPWITLNGQDVADSQFCIEFLSKKYGINFGAKHTPAALGTAWAFVKLAEESLIRVLALNRYVFNPDPSATGIPWYYNLILGYVIKKRSKAQGYGLHSRQEVDQIGDSDMLAINDFIGQKKFLLGDEVCDADASVFCMLVQIYYHERGHMYQYLKDKCPNCVRYIKTMKKEFWPDWKDRVQKNEEED